MTRIDPFADAVSLGRAMDSGRITSSDLTDLCLERIERHDRDLNAFVAVFTDQAKDAAKGLDYLRKANMPLGALHGVSVAIKDLVHITGHACSNGMTRKIAPSGTDAEIIRRLKKAGAIVIGATRMVECAFGGAGTSVAMGSPRNPWDNAVHRITGGSSSGSAAAVAAGLVPIAIGTDTGGSVRIPASLCGIVGFKPTFGAIPSDGVVQLSASLDTVGLMARSVRDVAAAFQTLSGCAVQLFTRLPTRGYRLGIPPRKDFETMDPEVVNALDTAVKMLEEAGATLVPFAFDEDFETLVNDVGIIIASEGFHSNRDHIAKVSDPAVRARLMAGQGVSADAYMSAQRKMAAARARAALQLLDVDALITATTPITAPELVQVDQASMVLSHFTRAVNYLGLCAISIPIASPEGAMPIGMQIIGQAEADRELLDLASWCETVCPQPDGATLQQRWS